MLKGEELNSQTQCYFFNHFSEWEWTIQSYWKGTFHLPHVHYDTNSFKYSSGFRKSKEEAGARSTNQGKNENLLLPVQHRERFKIQSTAIKKSTTAIKEVTIVITESS